MRKSIARELVRLSAESKAVEFKAWANNTMEAWVEI
jgi:hypothetical protein